ncbi:anthranilate synthase component 1 [Microbacterium sp. AG1240]|uniref:anthranilate synthase component I family protein n=1 Tax=Microbacterium sp. AG1240 TaxID=2183992 RepID=UPI000EB51B4E|nr:chorismate-binding protein [Microbacterium sp. AG1240]RKT36870.1 anthranilate synthase component 1 [Microbacterium sp. AG1240]
MSPPNVAVAVDAWIDPSDAYAGVVGDDPHGFWLDAGADASDGWSWLGIGRPESDTAAVDAVDVSRPTDRTDEAGPFRGGWVGWVTYEAGAAAAGAPTVAGDDPARWWLRVDEFLAFDHANRRVWAWAPTRERAARVAAAAARSRPDAALPTEPVASVARSRHVPSEYGELVERCRDHIREGDAYLLCLTTRFDVDGPIDARAVHRRLRTSSPSHHGGFVRAGGTALVSATPERFLSVTDGVVRTHPIKGTRPRSIDPVDDRRLADELRADPKERAENVMIVDLMRNDLARVCAPGTVTVERLLDVESYPAVHQLVSTIAGSLAGGTTLGSLLAAAFPAGSMTGAPKLSAMTILHELEAAPRGVFSGCFGWVGDDGGVDLAMVIRSVVVHPDGAYVGAGGGITWHSRPEAEVREVGWKARAPLAAIGAVLPPGW